MKKLITLSMGLATLGLSSCGKKEKELESKEAELEEELDQRRKKLNEVVRKVDELKTEDFSEKLVDLDLKLEAMTKDLELEKSEQAALSAEADDFVKKLEEYRKKFSL